MTLSKLLPMPTGRIGMKDLPVELHRSIVLACAMEKPASVQCLQRVSIHFNLVSRPFLYHSLRVDGPKQGSNLLARLETLEPKSSLIVHNLFLSTHEAGPTAPGGEEPRLTMEDVGIFQRLLVLCAPTLRNLTVQAGNGPLGVTLLARLYRVRFPALRDLSISGFYPFPSTASSGGFPVLRRLHLNGQRNPTGLFQLGVLEDAFPGLEEMRVSGLAVALSFVIEIEEAVREREGGEEDEGSGFARFPRGLRRLWVQAGPEPRGVGGLGVVSRKVSQEEVKDGVMMARLRAVCAGTVRDDGVPFAIQMVPREEGVDLYKEWVERRFWMES